MYKTAAMFFLMSPETHHFNIFVGLEMVKKLHEVRSENVQVMCFQLKTFGRQSCRSMWGKSTSWCRSQIIFVDYFVESF